ncbi:MULTISPECIES: nitrate reductase [Streptomyces]|uniref:Glycine zipper domain-containing protein n=1 Tax=Streptomyces antimycoticus TaxID=68175 RepID=A0ABD5JNB2_9ACTN|nr:MULTISPECIES: nitrate reductase [unclassified Streptomyces]MEE4589925.1 hypothetical protein [Streptomyces sp. DSM 41602]QTI87337.1 hypothetical protein AS97_40435 [Streptomyces sp. AgN23]RSS38026.1 nitrate reductase [Streptomyces sp. WAC05858]WTA78632.1 hypothetical protein OG751_00625 [Streptomyces antimycoticus]
MTDDDEDGTPFPAAGFVLGVLVGVPLGAVLGLSVFGSMVIGLVLGSGVGGILGLTFPVVRRSRRQSP